MPFHMKIKLACVYAPLECNSKNIVLNISNKCRREQVRTCLKSVTLLAFLLFHCFVIKIKFLRILNKNTEDASLWNMCIHLFLHIVVTDVQSIVTYFQKNARYRSCSVVMFRSSTFSSVSLSASQRTHCVSVIKTVFDEIQVKYEV